MVEGLTAWTGMKESQTVMKGVVKRICQCEEVAEEDSK